MAKRHGMSRRASRRNFVGKSHTHMKNLAPTPMRGGIRL